MNNKDFLEEFQVELIIPKSLCEPFENIIKKLNEHHVLLYDKRKCSPMYNKEDHYHFKIWCPTIYFAMAYFTLGGQFATHIYPLLQTLRDAEIKNKNNAKLR